MQSSDDKSCKSPFARDPHKDVKKVAKKLFSLTDKKTLLLAVQVSKWLNQERQFHGEEIVPKRRMKIYFNLVEKLKYCKKFEETVDNICTLKTINFKAM